MLPTGYPESLAVDPQLSAFLVALLTAAAATPLVRVIARRYEFYAVPVADRWHQRPVPLLGGVAMAAAFLVAIALHFNPLALGALVPCSLLMLALGAADDVWSIRPVPKLISQMVISGLMLSLSGPITITGLAVVDQLLAFFWLVGITNAVNLIDNMDGLAGGVSLLGALGLFALLLPDTATPLAIATAAFAGAVLGFLIFNFPPARIFMGDSGSFFLGFFLAGAGALALPRLSAERGMPLGVVPILLVLFVPIFDTAFVTLARRLTGRRAMVGGRDHTSHRIVALGASERAAVLFLYALAASAGVVAIALRTLDMRVAAGLLALFVLIAVGLAFVLAHIKEQPRDGSAKRADVPLVSEIAYRRRMVEVVMDAGLLALAYYAAFRIRFEEPDFSLFFTRFVQSVPIVIGGQIAGLYAAGKYRSRGPNASGAELPTLLKGLAFATTTSLMLVLVLYRFERFSRGVFLIDAFIAFFMLAGSRGVMGGIDHYLRKRRTGGTRAVIFGAGKGGGLLVRELLQNPDMNLQPVGFIDDDQAKQQLVIEGFRVLGTAADLADIASRHAVELVVISIRDIDARQVEAMLRTCRQLGLRLHRMRFSVEEVRAVPTVVHRERP